MPVFRIRAAVAVVAAVVAVGALAGCGRGEDPTIEGASGTTAPSVTVPGETTVPGAPGDSTATGATTPGGQPTGTAGSGGTNPGGGGGEPVDPAFRRPDAGTYRFRTTGTERVGTAVNPGQPQPIDEESSTVVTYLNDTDAQHSSDDGSQTSVLRYQPNQILLLTLDLNMGPVSRHFDAGAGALFIPIPLEPGQTWSWQLTDSTGATTVAQSSTAIGPEAITVNGAAVNSFRIDSTITLSGDIVGTIQLTSWVDPNLRTSVRIHQVTDVTYSGFRLQSDTTSDFVGFTAA